MKKILKIAIIAILLIAGGVTAYTYITKEDTVFNEDYVNGNTAGNLYNKGMMCESDGIIYFANPNDSNHLYSMNSDGTNLKKITSDTPNYINADDNYIYYVRNNVGEDIDYAFFSFHRNALCRISKETGHITILEETPSSHVSLLGNYLYYLQYTENEASTLHKMRIDGEEKEQVSMEPVYTCAANGPYFYYSGMYTDGSIHEFDTRYDTAFEIYKCNSFMPIVTNDNSVYYLDGLKNNALIRTDMTFSNFTTLTEDSIDSYNVYEDEIYYQKYDGKKSAICMIKTDGTGETVIKEGSFTNIYVTSNYVFFKDYHSKDVYYCKRNDLSNVMHFNPGVATEEANN
ncbi:MAG: DUF5050 domain-containing protein [Lachnospiraceae bacterium]|nr:DUF5050 domain-containing protein [Lachnospiraceae bacterium]